MRWYLDTEFLEDGKTIELISIALVNDPGTVEYYAGDAECDLSRVMTDEWLRQHVVPHLPSFDRGRGPVGNEGTFWKPKAEIGRDLLRLFGMVAGKFNETPEIWADHASYDWVALCQIYGRMIDLPRGMPMFCMDLMQDLRQRGIRRSDLPKQDPKTEHDALADARWLRSAHRYVQGFNW